MEWHKIINKELKKKYGTNDDGRPWFRIVFSSEQTEKRLATFNDSYANVYLRKVVEMKKYEYLDIIKDKWVLERLMIYSNSELCTLSGSYEPLHFFIDPKTGGYQRPTMKTIEFLFAMIANPARKLTAKDVDVMEDLYYDGYEKHVREELEYETLPNAPVSVPHNFNPSMVKE